MPSWSELPVVCQRQMVNISSIRTIMNSKEFSKASETNMGFVLLLMLSIIHIKRQMKDGLPLPLWFIIFMNLKLARFIRT